MARQPVAKGYQPYCNNPDGKENADLCAQWAAVQQVAEANRMSSLNLRFAIVSLWATIIGTVLLLWTLVETRETARRELRAYLFPDIAVIGIGDQPHNKSKVVSAVAIKNSGATPGRQVIHWTEVKYGLLKDHTEMAAPSNFENLHKSTVPPSGGITAGRTMEKALSRAEIAAIKKGEAAIFVFGAIEYVDVFDKVRRTDYRLQYAGQWPPPPNPVMNFCESGNDST